MTNHRSKFRANLAASLWTDRGMPIFRCPFGLAMMIAACISGYVNPYHKLCKSISGRSARPFAPRCSVVPANGMPMATPNLRRSSRFGRRFQGFPLRESLKVCPRPVPYNFPSRIYPNGPADKAKRPAVISPFGYNQRLC